MRAFHRELAPQIAKIARTVAFGDRAIEDMSEGGNFESKVIAAPQQEATLQLEEAPLVPRTLELVRVSDGHVYRPGADYLQTGDGFTNIRIPPGEALTAEYLHEDLYATGHRIIVNGKILAQRTDLHLIGDVSAADNEGEDASELVFPTPPLPENGAAPVLMNSWVNRAGSTGPARYYKDRGRVHLAGVISSGTVTAETVLFTLPVGYRPAYECWLPTLTNAGPVKLDVKPTGDVEVGAGPFEAGNDWLTLDGLSFRPGWSSGLYPSFYPRMNLYPRS